MWECQNFSGSASNYLSVFLWGGGGYLTTQNETPQFKWVCSPPWFNMVWIDECLGSVAVSSENQENTQRKGNKKGKIWQIFLLHESDGGLFVGTCSVSLLSSHRQKMQSQQTWGCIPLSVHMRMSEGCWWRSQIKKKWTSPTLPSCCGGVLDYISVSPSFFLSSPLFHSWPTLVFSFQLHQPCLLGVIARLPLPLFLLPPPYPVSQLSLVSVMDHIWERLSRSRLVWRSTARELIWILPVAGTFLSGGGRQTLLQNQCMFTGGGGGGVNDYLLLVTSLSACASVLFLPYPWFPTCSKFPELLCGSLPGL